MYNYQAVFDHQFRIPKKTSSPPTIEFSPNIVNVAEKPVNKVVLELGDERMLPILNNFPEPRRELILDAATESIRTGNPTHTFSKYPASHIASLIQHGFINNQLPPALPICTPCEAFASNQEVVEILLSNFQVTRLFWFSFTIPNVELISHSSQRSKTCPPLVNAVCALSASNITNQYILHPSNRNSNDDVVFNTIQHEIYSGLKSIFRASSTEEPQQRMIDEKHTESSTACVMILAGLERLKSNFKRWGDMIQIGVAGFTEIVTRNGEQAVFQDLVANPSVEPGDYGFF